MNTAQKVNAVQRAAVIDELGRIEKEIASAEAAMVKKLGTKPERAAMLREEILGWYEHANAILSFVDNGKQFVATASARSNVTTVTNLLGVQERLGAKEFLKLAKVGIGDLRKALTAAQLSECTRTVRTGPRTLVVIEKEKGAAAK